VWPEYWPEYEIVEREGRLVLGGCPRTRRGNAVGLAVALLVALPVFLVFLWLGGLEVRVLAPLGVLSVLGGLVTAWKAAEGDWELSEGRDIVFDRAADRVAKKGARLCAASEITRVQLTSSRGTRKWLLLVLGGQAVDAAIPERRLRILEGLGLADHGQRVAAYLRVPFVTG
jgi:hypothetical protein